MKDYKQYITSEFQNSPKYLQLVETLTNIIQDNNNIIKTLPTIFDIDTAIGDQLDKIGEWVGFNRVIAPEIGDSFFSWGVPNLGYGQARWKTVGATSGVTILDDETYRVLLKVKILLNHYDGSIPIVVEQLEKLSSALNIIDIYIDNLRSNRVLLDNLESSTIYLDNLGDSNTRIILEDTQNMKYNIGVLGYVSTLFQALLTRGYFDIRPSGVEVNYIRPSSGGNYFFGFGITNEYIRGFGEGSFKETIPTI